MKENLKQRKTVNEAVAICVATHLGMVMLAARFETEETVQLALWSGIALYFAIGPALWLWHRTTLPINADEGLTDIREAMAAARALPKYDPEVYFDTAKGLLIGLDIDKRMEPIYVPWERVRKTHVQVVGTTGSGKGVATTMMLVQCALAGECVVIFDPKFPGDEFAPRVYNRIAQQYGIPFYLVNLAPTMPPPFDKQYPQTPPQINIFRDCTQSELEELLMTAFDLADKGGSADFYRLYDRLACQDVCERATANGNSPTMKDIVYAAHKSREIDEEKGKKFKANIKEIAKLPVLNTAAGLDLKKIINENAILYIIGSIRNAQVMRVQKMLLLRIMQVIEQRDRNKKLRFVAMMLDELKYLLSKPALQGLGTVRDKSCHILLAHQTNGDLRDCEGLDPESVSAAVKTNTSLKLIYRATDDNDAKWASNLSGTIVIQQQSSHMQQGMFDAAEGQYRQAERPLLTPNHMLSLPDMTGMFFGIGLSRRIQVGPMQLGQQPTIIPAVPLEPLKMGPKQTKENTHADEESASPNVTETNEMPLENIIAGAAEATQIPAETTEQTAAVVPTPTQENATVAVETQRSEQDTNLENLI